MASKKPQNKAVVELENSDDSDIEFIPYEKPVKPPAEVVDLVDEDDNEDNSKKLTENDKSKKQEVGGETCDKGQLGSSTSAIAGTSGSAQSSRNKNSDARATQARTFANGTSREGRQLIDANAPESGVDKPFIQLNCFYGNHPDPQNSHNQQRDFPKRNFQYHQGDLSNHHPQWYQRDFPNNHQGVPNHNPPQWHQSDFGNHNSQFHQEDFGNHHPQWHQRDFPNHQPHNHQGDFANQNPHFPQRGFIPFRPFHPPPPFYRAPPPLMSIHYNHTPDVYERPPIRRPWVPCVPPRFNGNPRFFPGRMPNRGSFRNPPPPRFPAAKKKVAASTGLNNGAGQPPIPDVNDRDPRIRKRLERESGNAAAAVSSSPPAKKVCLPETRREANKERIKKYLKDHLALLYLSSAEHGNPTETILTNEEILSQIFNHLAIADRKNFRLVNKVWMVSTLVCWRDTVKVVLGDLDKKKEQRIATAYGVKNSRRFFKESKSGTTSKLKVFGNVASSRFYRDAASRPVPFSNFIVFDSNMKLPPPSELGTDWGNMTKDDEILRFFDTFGSSIKSLELVGVRFGQEAGVLNVLQWILLEKCPSLKELSITCEDFDDTAHTESEKEKKRKEKWNNGVANHLTFLEIKVESDSQQLNLSIDTCKQLLSMIPNIKVLKITKEVFSILQLLKKPVPKEYSGFQLKSLNLLDLLTSKELPHLAKYMENALGTLEDLKFGVIAKKQKKEEPLDLSKIFGAALNIPNNLTCFTLEIDFRKKSSYWITQLNDIDFPNLTQLRLKVTAFHQNEDSCPVRMDFRGLIGAPRLKIFECVIGVKSKDSIGYGKSVLKKQNLVCRDLVCSINDFEVWKDMKELFFFLNEKFDEECLAKLSEWMPHLKKLALIADATTFPVIFKLWNKLEKVTLLHGSSGIEEEHMSLEQNRYNQKVEIVKMEKKFACFDEEYFREF